MPLSIGTQFFILKQKAQEDAGLEIPVLGMSMWPQLLSGDLVLIKSQPQYSIGDVLVFKYQTEILIHRLVQIQDAVLLCKGDNTFRLEPITDPDAIIGRAVSIKRSGKTFSVIPVLDDFIQQSIAVNRVYMRTRSLYETRKSIEYIRFYKRRLFHYTDKE